MWNYVSYNIQVSIIDINTHVQQTVKVDLRRCVIRDYVLFPSFMGAK